MSQSTPAGENTAAPSPHAIPDVYPNELASAEDRLIDTLETGRRARAGLTDVKAPRIGLALSGGGIRSATFCLGVLQSLAGAKLLKRIDYLSTVSGGGYIGGFLGAWISRNGNDVNSVETELPQSNSAKVGYLRENGRYIAPNGSGDLWAAVATALRSWVAVLAVLGVFVFAFFLLAALGRELLWTFGLAHPTCLPAWINQPCALQWFWASVWWAVAIDLAVVVVAPLIVAYWLLGNRPRRFAPITCTALALVVAGVIWYSWGQPEIPCLPLGDSGAGCGRWLALVAVAVALLAWLKAFVQAWRANDLAPARRWLTNALVVALGVTLALAVFGLVDSLAASWLVLQQGDTGWRSTVLHGIAAAVIAAAKFLWPMVSKGLESKKRASLPLAVVAGIGAALLALVLFTLLDYWALRFAQAVGAQSAIGDACAICQAPEWCLLLAAVVLLALSVVLGHPLGFVNLSSLHQIYTARLTRAYLGASNPIRFDPKKNPRGQNVTEPVPGDQVGMADYHPHEHGGPLHLINVTVNETISGKSQVEQRDRKGIGMAVGPAGISLGRVHHTLFTDPAVVAGNASLIASALRPVAEHKFLREQVRVFPLAPPPGSVSVMGYKSPVASSATAGAAGLAGPGLSAPSQSRGMERLPLGSWVGVSGAAFTTGLGAQTSIGISFLAGLFNVRLGYWWDSDIAPGERDERTQPSLSRELGDFATELFPAQLHLLDELLARFHGTARRRWYLSDGGHFENTAAYELIRRRVPVIIVCDCGADPDGTFDDVGNLVRKARLDFNAEIAFADPAELQNKSGVAIPAAVGKFDDLRQTNARGPLGRVSSRHAALALVFYDGKTTHDSVLLLVKPTMTSEEPPDLLNYRSAHRTFPQEPTADQFFDEAQWESYRKLGEIIGQEIFPTGKVANPSWLWTLAGAKLT